MSAERPMAEFANYLRGMANDIQRPDGERRLWLKMAREVDAYLEPEPDALADHPELFT